jgi:hypothetical protein
MNKQKKKEKKKKKTKTKNRDLPSLKSLPTVSSMKLKWAPTLWVKYGADLSVGTTEFPSGHKH